MENILMKASISSSGYNKKRKNHTSNIKASKYVNLIRMITKKLIRNIFCQIPIYTWICILSIAIY